MSGTTCTDGPARGRAELTFSLGGRLVRRGDPLLSVKAIHLVRALSNQGLAAKLGPLSILRQELLRSAAKSPRQSATPPPRIGAIANAVCDVLAVAPESMRIVEIHRAVELRLDRPVNVRTIKNCLSEGARGANPKYERVARGRYRPQPAGRQAGPVGQAALIRGISGPGSSDTS